MVAAGQHEFRVGRCIFSSTVFKDMLSKLMDVPPQRRALLRWSDDAPGLVIQQVIQLPRPAPRAPVQGLDPFEEWPADEEVLAPGDSSASNKRRKTEAVSLSAEDRALLKAAKKKKEQDKDESSDEEYDNHWSFAKCLNRALKPVAALKPEERVSVPPSSLLPVLRFLPDVPALEDESDADKVNYTPCVESFLLVRHSSFLYRCRQHVCPNSWLRCKRRRSSIRMARPR